MKRVLFFLSVVLMLLPQVVFGATETYEYSGMWPVLKQPWYFSFPEGIAIDSSGNVYVADSNNNRIQKFAGDGKFIAKWDSYGSGDEQFNWPSGIAVDNSGNVYVADTFNSRILKFTANGTFVTKWGSYGSGDEQFHWPSGIAVDNSGNVYVVDTNNYRIQKFSGDGKFILKWGSKGSGDGQFNDAQGDSLGTAGITIDNSGNVYVADTYNSRIQKFTADGTFITKWGSQGSGDGQFNDPSSIATDINDNIYVVDTLNDRIQKFTADGKFISKWGNFGNGDSQFYSPNGIALDKSGNVYVVDTNNQRIQKFNSNGQFISRLGSDGSNDGWFTHPSGIATDTSNVYVVDTENHRIQKFSTDGTFIAKWGSQGNSNGQFNWPDGIDIDSSGNVYVADSVNNRIQKFAGDGKFITKWGSYGSGDGQFYYPSIIATDSNGNVYVADTLNYRIQIFSSSGTFIAKWGGKGSGNGQFDLITGMAIDISGNVFVSDPNNSRIQKFTADGKFLTKWESVNFYSPGGITIDSSGNAYVTDLWRRRILKLSFDGTFIAQIGNAGTNPGEFSQPDNIAISQTGNIYVSDSHNNRIQKFKSSSATTAATKPKAIIVAGGGKYTGNYLWDATELNANYVYRALNYQGYAGDNIYYISSDTQLDLNNDGKPDIRGDATNTNLQYAITEWAKDAESVVLYMVDHGGIDSFRMGQTETLSAANLNTWLNTLQDSMTGNLTVIYDACHAGSFISELSPPSGKQRMLIMSTSSGEAAYFLTDGSLSFSSFFWNYIFSGTTTYQAFEYAKKSAIKGQDPLLDANGNGIGNEETDLNTAKTHYLGGSNSGSGYIPYIYIGGLGGLGYVDSSGLLVGEDIPYISEVSSDQTLNGQTGSSADITLNGQTEATISIGKITTTGTIDHVWAVVKRPDFVNNPDDAVTSLPKIEFKENTTTNKYEGTYKDFSQTGTYTLSVYAHDSKDGTAAPFVLTVKQTAGITTNAYTVTPSAGTGGSISPNIPQTVSQRATTTFTVMPDAGYTASVSGTCGGNLSGSTYTTNAITASCTVVASFTPPTSDNCTVKFEARNNDYYLNAPIVTLSLNGSTSNYYAELIYVPKNDNQFWFKLTANAGVVTDISSFSSCQHSTITVSGNDFVLHLAKVDLSGTYIWADFKYSPTDDGNLWFVYTGSGSN